MSKVKIIKPKKNDDSNTKSAKQNEELLKKLELSESIAAMDDTKLVNKSFKNVHIKPADEQEFEGNI